MPIVVQFSLCIVPTGSLYFYFPSSSEEKFAVSGPLMLDIAGIWVPFHVGIIFKLPGYGNQMSISGSSFYGIRLIFLEDFYVIFRSHFPLFQSSNPFWSPLIFPLSKIRHVDISSVNIAYSSLCNIVVTLCYLLWTR